MKILIKSNSRRLDRLQSVLEWFVVAFFVIGGVSLFFAEPITTGSALVKTLGSQTAGYVYGVLFLVEGGILAYSKIAKNKSLHGSILMIACLTLFFTVWLEALVIGFGIFSIDNIIMVLITGWSYLRWRLRTVYLDPNEFSREVDLLGADSPPSRRIL